MITHYSYNDMLICSVYAFMCACMYQSNIAYVASCYYCTLIVFLMCNVCCMCLLIHVHSERDRFRTKDDALQKQLQTLRSDIERLSRIVDTVDTLIKQDWPKKYVSNLYYVILSYNTCNYHSLMRITHLSIIF
jgi:hypothetical protein